MKRFEDTRCFQLLNPFIRPILHRLLFRDESYVLFASQILLSGLLYLVATSLQVLLLAAVTKMGVQSDLADLLKSFIYVGILTVIFWNVWYCLTLIFRMMGAMRFPNFGLSPRHLSGIVTAGITLSVGMQEGEALGYVGWFYALLALVWAYSCLRPTLFGSDQ